MVISHYYWDTARDYALKSITLQPEKIVEWETKKFLKIYSMISRFISEDQYEEIRIKVGIRL